MQSTRAKRSFSKGLRSLVRSRWIVFWLLIAGLLALPAWRSSNETESWIPATPVEASSPTKSIEAVRVGDIVMARDDVTGLIVPKRVVRVFHNTSDHLRILTIRNADGATQQIKTTNEHPFFVPDRGWTLASELTPGTQLQQFDDTSAILIATHLESHPKGIPTYNVEVEDFHTYFVADTSARGPPRYLLTHNMCAKAAGDLADEAGEGLVKSADNVTPNVLDSDKTRLWRAVEPEELDDVLRYGDYDIHHNSTFKRFAFDEGSLDDFIRVNPDRTYTKTYIDVPTDKLDDMVRHPDSGGVGDAIGIDVYETPEFYNWFDKVNIVDR